MCAISFQHYSLDILNWIEELGWLAPALFIIAYTLASIFFLPSMVMTFAGGVIFGPIMGVFLNLLGATLGAAFSFLITRYLAYDWFRKKRGQNLNKLITNVEKKGWVFIAFLRLFPMFPFSLVNYGLGLTKISFRLYLVTTVLFLIPVEIIYTYFGHAGRHALSNPEQFYKSGGFFFLGLASVFLILITLIKRKESKPEINHKRQETQNI